mmetsp:Transcript_10807/g.16074  ORF Transcript_10807/g.16074 Transcript_10807/m.16074 type:complete len:245 (-) Transcript_10807:109-843(-)
MVHWDDCFKAFSEGRLAETTELLTEWIFKKHTAFVYIENETEGPKLDLPWWFGLFCWTYTLGGAVMISHPPPKWTYRSNFDYRTYALLLLFVQGPFSFMADYVNMTNESIWHVLDRLLASPMSILTLAKLVCTHWYMPSIFAFVLDFLAFGFAIMSFTFSQLAQSNHDQEGFIFWHNCWHLYPILKIALFLTDMHIWDGLSAAKEKLAAAERLSHAASEKIKNRSIWSPTLMACGLYENGKKRD